PPCGISIKTRIGFESVEEWPKLWSIFRQYPLSMLIVHPRTRREFYKGHAHRELFGLCSDAPFPCVYNGDLVSIADFEDTLERCPTTGALMVGRGLVTNPALARRWNGGAALGREELRAFHDELLDEYRTKWPPKAVLGHMQEIMWYMLCCFDEEKKARKAIRKAQDVKGYTEAIDRLFETCPFRDEPCFHFGDE
ncbi:MAG: tRNA-dihydrouridine synthase family protein, partial [Clostridiales bacterium]|nr:tRNA-dihydrouridine synthase family protein [Clostridiales bacterium]